MYRNRWRFNRKRSAVAACLVIVLAALLASPASGAWYFGGEEYTLTAKHSGMCLDVAYFSAADGGDIVQSFCSGGSNQTWKLYRTSNSYYLLVAKHSGKCMDVVNGSLQHAADVIQWACSGGDSQLWQPILIKNDNGTPFYVLVNKKSGKCLDVAYFSTAFGGNVLQADCTATDNQLWDVFNLQFGYHGF